MIYSAAGGERRAEDGERRTESGGAESGERERSERVVVFWFRILITCEDQKQPPLSSTTPSPPSQEGSLMPPQRSDTKK